MVISAKAVENPEMVSQVSKHEFKEDELENKVTATNTGTALDHDIFPEEDLDDPTKSSKR